MTMAPDGRAASADRRRAARHRHQLGMKAQYFLDVCRMRIERLDQRFARQNERLMEGIEVVHHAFAYLPLGIAKPDDGSRAYLRPRDAARIGDGVSLSHERFRLNARWSR